MKEESSYGLEESIESIEESAKEELWDESNEKQQEDPFTALMFGSRKDRGVPDPFGPFRSSDQQQQQSNKPMINYQELMFHFDTLWTSMQELKPLFSKIQPFIKQFWQKK